MKASCGIYLRRRSALHATLAGRQARRSCRWHVQARLCERNLETGLWARENNSYKHCARTG
jgi:hypothetical protein